MKARIALVALLLIATPVFAQSNGWQEIQNGWGEIQTVPGYSVMPAPSGCVASSVPFFGASVTLGCDGGIAYTAATGTLKVGANATSGDNAGVLITRGLTGSVATGFHAVRDESTWNASGVGLIAYSSFDAVPVLSGAATYAHLHGYQARPYFAGSGSLTSMSGFTAQGYGTGNIGTLRGFYFANYAGSGTVTTQVALYVDALTAGGSNYVIYALGPTPSYHGGPFQTGSTIQAGGLVTGTNLGHSVAQNSVAFGVGSTNIGYFNTYLGYDVAPNRTDNAQKNTVVGVKAGNAITANNRNVFIGYNAGYYETGSDRLIIDNAPRSSEADARAKALLSGVFDADPANQILQVNGRVKPIGVQYQSGTRPTCDATTRGTVWYVAGGAGVADTFEVCRKDAADNYAWVSLF